MESRSSECSVRISASQAPPYKLLSRSKLSGLPFCLLLILVMDDSQWCLDECPSCATVVSGSSIYCAQCEPDFKLPPEEPEQDDEGFAEYMQRTATRVSAWTVDCYKSSRAAAAAPSSVPSVFPSPCRRKLHLRKVYPTSWLNAESPPILSSAPLSAPTAVQLLVTSSTGSPSPSSTFVGSPARPKTNVYLFSSSDYKHRSRLSLPCTPMTPSSSMGVRSTGTDVAHARDCNCLPPLSSQKQPQYQGRRPPHTSRRST
ncbi:hypothetical protein FB45DRAFT_910283 [Roridomyces roridus]|uniref:Uncharacterized protein n=1 Tax=Roridomyces roridus TaxID=1738132 RepID=A0AAD7FP23_9AGAR|nr:hypothetical protein FB45DRAFT_910283 [Roridomyces roridus]